MPAAGIKLCDAIGRDFVSGEVSWILEGASRALKLTSQPTPLIYLTFTPPPSWSQDLSPEEHLHFSYPKLGIDFVLKARYDYKYPGMKGEGELSLKEEDYNLYMLEVDNLTVYNGRDGADTEVILGEDPESAQVLSFSTFPAVIGEWFGFDDLTTEALFFKIKADTRYEKFERKLGEPDYYKGEPLRTQKEGKVYELIWSYRSPGLGIEFERMGGERAEHDLEMEGEAGEAEQEGEEGEKLGEEGTDGEEGEDEEEDDEGEDRWVKYTLINS